MTKIDRIASWILFITIILYAITGYGMTKGLIDSNFSHTWHLGYLGAIGLIAFVIHTSWATHLALKRKNIWNVYTKSLLVIFYLSLISFFCFMQFFYQESKSKEIDHPKTTIENSGTSIDIITTVFTAETLEQYNGLNGQPAYIAVDGIVYDVSSLFVNGQHYGCSAGQDVTDEFDGERRHNDNMLEGYTVVGTYE
jgi:predicted heme/steroid binding protein